MNMESREKTSQKTARHAAKVRIVGEITAITARLPHGPMRFSRRGNVWNNKEIEREERDSLIYLTTPRTPAYMPPARARARGVGFLVRFSFLRPDNDPPSSQERNRDMNRPQCWHCRYYMPDEDFYPTWEQDQRSGCGQGTCRRHCPIAHKPDEDERVVHYGYWPVVLSGDWCGEFRPRQRDGQPATPTSLRGGPHPATITTEICICLNAGKKRPASGGGGPDYGPKQSRTGWGENQSTHDATESAPRVKGFSTNDTNAHVGPRSPQADGGDSEANGTSDGDTGEIGGHDEK